jgi:NADPH-dependent ferric siderophore reductase
MFQINRFFKITSRKSMSEDNSQTGADGTESIVQRVRHELKLRELVVARVEPNGPGFLSITFTGESLEDFVSMSFDDHVKFMFDDANGEQVRRDYTPRHFSQEKRELTIEFALHGDGKAAEWALQAHPGQRVRVGGPRGSMIVPNDLGWHLLVADETGMPAISRRLEELAPDSQAFVFILADAADRRSLDSRARVDAQWCTTPIQLLEALRAVVLPGCGSGFAWGGGEAALMAQVRQILLEKQVPRQRMRVSAYWKRGAIAHHEQLD